ncbi:MAG: rod shape-determining protein MreD [Gammaproteobacteria bacterium]|nr:rod shape-determining protein MreD [Gammaproteobacteria bacterium]
MVNNKQQHGYIFIVISIIIAMILMLVPLPENIRFIRPEWVVMTLIYWAMALPKRVGVGFAWCTGLIMDVTLGGQLGILAFSYALVVYFVLRFHLQLRQYPLWQQALSIMALVFLVNVISMLVSSRTFDFTLWLPAVMSTVLWPVMYALLRSVRRNFHVN